MIANIGQRIKNRLFRKSIPNACRNVTVLPDDIFLVSYPKSGNTWLRFIIANLLYSNRIAVSFSNIGILIPDIYKYRDQDLLQLPTPRILKSHECFDTKYPKVIYIVRDPRDVAVSYYHYLIKIQEIAEDYPINSWIKSFVKGTFIPQFGTWSQNVESWLFTNKNTQNLLLIRYEDLLNNSFKEVSKIAAFLSLNVSEEQIAKAIALSSADNMRRSEKQSGWQPNQNSRKDKAFVRAAKSGNWKTDLSEYAVKEIECNWGSLMQKLNYLQ